MAVTPNMGLVLPDVGVTIGPTWASTLNAALDDVDAHDHTSGNGRRVPVAGLNINADLPFTGYGATGLQRVQLTSQATALSAITYPVGFYAVNGDAYWNDSAGRQIRLTINGNVAGGQGSISGMLYTTSVDYISGSATFQFANAGTLAGLEAGSYILRQSANPAGSAITIAAPTSGIVPYTLTVPAVSSTIDPLTQIAPFLYSTTSSTTAASLAWGAFDVFKFSFSSGTLSIRTGAIFGEYPTGSAGTTGNIQRGTVTGQATPNNTTATVTGNLGLGTITGGTAFSGLSWKGTGNIAVGTITGGAYDNGGTVVASGNIAVGTITGGDTGFGQALGNIAIGTVTGGSFYAGGTYYPQGNIKLGTITGGSNGYGVPIGNIDTGTITGGSFYGGGWLPDGNLALNTVTGGANGNLALNTVFSTNLASNAATNRVMVSQFTTTSTTASINVTSSTYTTVATATVTVDSENTGNRFIHIFPESGFDAQLAVICNRTAGVNPSSVNGRIRLVVTDPSSVSTTYTRGADAYDYATSAINIPAPLPFFSVQQLFVATGTWTVSVQVAVFQTAGTAGGAIIGSRVRAVIGY